MSLSCPRCKTIQPQDNRNCSECGIALPLASEEMKMKEAAMFRFAEPVLLSEAGQGNDTLREEGAREERAREELPRDEPRLPPVPPKSASGVVSPPMISRPQPEILLPTVLLTEANLPPAPLPAASRPEEKPAETKFPETPQEPPERSAVWKIPVLSTLVSAAILLTALAGSAWIVARASHQARQGENGHSATFAASLQTAPNAAVKSASSALPLTLFLQSASAGRHVPVGSPVVITAFAMLAPGQSATLALLCRPERGRQRMFSFAEGRLCSASWTPLVPGRYQFTATALDDQSHAAAAHPLWIMVDKPSPSAHMPSVPTVNEPGAAASPLPLPVVRVSRSLAERRSLHTVMQSGHRHKKTRLTAYLTTRLRPVLPMPPSVSSPALSPPPALYHVVAASFRLPGHADILARALRARGLPATLSRRRAKNGSTAYVVEIGTYSLPGEAHQKTLALQRSGYPAYTQRLR